MRLIAGGGCIIWMRRYCDVERVLGGEYMGLRWELERLFVSPRWMYSTAELMKLSTCSDMLFQSEYCEPSSCSRHTAAGVSLPPLPPSSPLSHIGAVPSNVTSAPYPPHPQPWIGTSSPEKNLWLQDLVKSLYFIPCLPIIKSSCSFKWQLIRHRYHHRLRSRSCLPALAQSHVSNVVELRGLR